MWLFQFVLLVVVVLPSVVIWLMVFQRKIPNKQITSYSHTKSRMRPSLSWSLEPCSSLLISYPLTGQHVSWRGTHRLGVFQGNLYCRLSDCQTTCRMGELGFFIQHRHNLKCWTPDLRLRLATTERKIEFEAAGWVWQLEAVKALSWDTFFD